MDHQEMKTPYLVLGMDPGIASCGFCLIDLNNHKILEMGVHLFDAPQEAKTKVSLAAGRRSARSARRNNQRTKQRLSKCIHLLREAELVPQNADQKWFQSQKGDKPILKLRSAALKRLLSDRELAQVLYSLCGHRGYIPHGEGRLGESDDAEGRKVLTAIRDNTRKMEKGNFLTVGEYLHSQGKSRNEGGNYELCILNSQIVEEVRTILDRQRSFGAPKSSLEFEESYIDCLTWEKSSLNHDEHVYSLVGPCSYFPDQKRAAAATISSELCRAYERLGHLVMVDENNQEHRLSANDRRRYISFLFSTTPIKKNKDCKVRYSNIRTDLDLSSSTVFKGVDMKDESKEIFEPKAWRKVRQCLENPNLLERMISNRELGDAIGEALTYASSEESLLEQLEKLCLSQDEIEHLLNIPFSSKIFSGYGSRSLKALDILISAFEDGSILTLADAEEATGLLALRLDDTENRCDMLQPYSDFDETCNNPVVLRALSRMRKIVNSIIRIYGVPHEIHIELGTELKRSKREKDVLAKRQRENAAKNKHLAEIAAGIMGIEPSEVPGKILRKLDLYKEQKERDIYTGGRIELERLILDDCYCEIDHILPYSRTCDDSRANKVLALQSSNQNKGNRTPFEWMTSGEEKAPDWQQYCARVRATVRWRRKQQHLLNDDLPMGISMDFIDRNLNDDRYMSRAVKNYLEKSLLFPEDSPKMPVVSVSGGATATLRWLWGLNFGTSNEKDRSDDRHHAVDAAVIAACSRSAIKKIADTRSEGPERFKKHRESRLANTQPWKTFALEVLEKRESIIPTRMVDHGVTGRAFEETVYKIEGYSEEGSYPIVSSGGSKPKKMGNVRYFGEKSVRPLDGIAFVRLWLDPDARPAGRVKGKWYAEPVYYAEIPNLKAGQLVPRAVEIRTARVAWKPVPESAMTEKPIVIRMGDVVCVNGQIARFAGLNINSCRLLFKSVLTGNEGNIIPSLGSWGRDTQVHVIEEDCLAKCYEHVVIDREKDIVQLT